MKKQLLSLTAALVALTACARSPQENFSVTLPVKSDVANHMAYLVNWDTDAKMDSVIVNGTAVTFKGNVADPYMGRIIIDGKRGPLFIVEKGKITIDPATGDAKGTPLNDKLNSQSKKLEQLQSKIETLSKSATDSVGKAKVQTLMTEYEGLIPSFYKESPNTPVGLYWFMQSAYEMTLPEFDAALKQYPALAASKRVEKRRAALLASAETSVGKHYKDFTITYKGKAQKLSQFVKPGKYTLVDFWASWCRPCLKEIRTIKELYAKYHAKGLDVVGVAVWDEPQNTEAAIQTHKIEWPCIINAQSIPTDLYGISGIPCIILINPDGIIVSRDRQGAELVEDVTKAMESYVPPTQTTEKTDSIK